MLKLQHAGEQVQVHTWKGTRTTTILVHLALSIFITTFKTEQPESFCFFVKKKKKKEDM